MRTTIRVDENLLKQAKQYAIRSGKTLTAVIEDALRESMEKQKLLKDREPVHVVTFRGKGLHPGVDLDDTASLLDIMEVRDDSH